MSTNDRSNEAVRGFAEAIRAADDEEVEELAAALNDANIDIAELVGPNVSRRTALKAGVGMLGLGGVLGAGTQNARALPDNTAKIGLDEDQRIGFGPADMGFDSGSSEFQIDWENGNVISIPEDKSGELAVLSETGGGTGSFTSDGAAVASPGELQTKLDNSGGSSWGDWGYVKCEAGATFTSSDESFPIEVPKYTVLDTNGAIFKLSNDNDVIKWNTQTFHVGHLGINTRSVPTPRTADNWVIDGDYAGEPFNAVGGVRPFWSNGQVWHWGNQPNPGNVSNTEGNAVAIYGHDTNQDNANDNYFVTHCWLGRHYANGYNNAVMVSSDSFVNDNFLELTAVDVNWTGTHVGGDQGKTLIWGHSQGADQVGYFRNLGTSNKSFRFWGHLEDPQRPTGTIIDGAGIKVWPTSPINASQHSINFDTGTTIDNVGYENTAGEPSYNGNEFGPGDFVVTDDGLYKRALWRGASEGDWYQVVNNSGISP